MHAKILAVSLFCNLTTAAVLDRRVNDAVAITVPTAVPSGASDPIDPGFAGFAFEERSFYLYFGTPSNPNDFSRNLVNAITEKTKAEPNIRVGGSSLDDSQYDPNQSEAIKIPEGERDKGIPSNMTFGPSYFDAFATLPNARYVIDIPMKKDNLENSKLFAKDAYEKIGAARIVALEIGNEPNNYGKSIADYVKQWKNWSARILKALGLNENEKVYQAVCLGSETGVTNFPGGTPQDWKVPDIFEQGLKKIESRIKSVSMHYYQTKANPNSDLQHDLMSHSAVVRGSAFVKDAVDYLNKRSPPIPLALGEVGSVLGNASNNDPLQAVLGSALWQADFFLYSMSIGVKRINLQSGLSFPFALWNPTYTNDDKTVPASVHPAFYGQIFSAEFIGDCDNVRVSNIDLHRHFLSVYAAYDEGKLGRVAISNLELWSANDAKPRPQKKITLDIGAGSKSVKVKKLTSPGGGTAGVDSITWGGMQWTAASGGNGVQALSDTVTLPVAEGKVEVDVKASEAVMVFLEY